LTNLLGSSERLLNFEKVTGATLIQYREDKFRAQWFHTRAYILAYTNIALRRQLQRIPVDDVIRVCTDAIYAKTLPKAVQDTLVEDHPRYGQWRHKIPGNEWCPEAAA
jgi:hypothetical protein